MLEESGAQHPAVARGRGCPWVDGAVPRHAIPDPAFVRAQLIPDSSERNDDKLYFFFREKSADAPLSPGVYSRIGRICLVGGAAGRQGSGRGVGRAERRGLSVAERRRGPLLPREQVEHLPEGPARLLRARTRWD